MTRLLLAVALCALGGSAMADEFDQAVAPRPHPDTDLTSLAPAPKPPCPDADVIRRARTRAEALEQEALTHDPANVIESYQSAVLTERLLLDAEARAEHRYADILQKQCDEGKP